MKSKLIQTAASMSEAHVRQAGGRIEYWLAGNLRRSFGYARWRDFISAAISRVKAAWEVSGHPASDHFVDVNKMINLVCESSHHIVSSITSQAIDALIVTGYRYCHIRPLAVRPLDHPEREPTPWGFLFSATEKPGLQHTSGVRP